MSEVVCLSRAIWSESRGEKIQGQLAVAKTILTRKSHSSWPNTVCEVVYEPYQFHNIDRAFSSHHTDTIAKKILTNPGVLDHLPPFTHFWSGVKVPHWARNKNYVKIGNHYFLEQKGR
jgi:spore germination cell wall hydrolase CwlJ-like protein